MGRGESEVWEEYVPSDITKCPIQTNKANHPSPCKQPVMERRRREGANEREEDERGTTGR